MVTVDLKSLYSIFKWKYCKFGVVTADLRVSTVYSNGNIVSLEWLQQISESLQYIQMKLLYVWSGYSRSQSLYSIFKWKYCKFGVVTADLRVSTVYSNGNIVSLEWLQQILESLQYIQMEIL